MFPLYGDLLTAPALFVLLLALVMVALPAFYLIMALAERRGYLGEADEESRDDSMD